MTKYLISFPSLAMDVADEKWEQVGLDSRQVVQHAKEAGVCVFRGGMP